MSGHTPGPWYTKGPISRIGHYAITDGDGVTICDPSPMGQANARLITAAPDLLAILEELIDIEGPQPGTAAWADKARAAIAKATGGAL